MAHASAIVAGLVAWAAAILWLSSTSATHAGDIALGRHLAGECVTCHPRDNRNVGIPVINGWPPDQFVAVLRSYKTKERDNPVMQSVASSLNEEEIAALASYFATLKP